MEAYNQRRSLILNVLIRWRTPVDLINSVLCSKKALLEYFQQKAPGIDQGKSHTLRLSTADYNEGILIVRIRIIEWVWTNVDNVLHLKSFDSVLIVTSFVIDYYHHASRSDMF
jgi:hypothetical protein